MEHETRLPLDSYNSATIAITIWSSEQCAQGKIISFLLFGQNRSPSQKTLMSRVYIRATQDLLPVSPRIQSFRNAMGFPDAKTRIHCTPSKYLRTCMTDPDFRIWSQCYCEIPLFQPDMECSRESAKSWLMFRDIKRVRHTVLFLSIS